MHFFYYFRRIVQNFLSGLFIAHLQKNREEKY